MKNGNAKLLALLTAMALAGGAHAQTTDVVIMRRQIAPPNPRPVNPTTPGNGHPGTTPGTGTEETPSTPTPTQTPTPIAVSYRWFVGDYGDPASLCSDSTTHTRPVTCERIDAAGLRTVVADSNCTSERRPETIEYNVISWSGCTYEWVQGGFTPWSSTCSPSATRTQTVVCRRSDNSTARDEKYCTETKPPVKEGPATVVTSCGGTVNNAGFETGTLDGWVIGAYFPASRPIISTMSHSGGYSVTMPANPKWSGTEYETIEQTVTTKVGQKYTLSFWAYVTTSEGVTMSYNGMNYGTIYGQNKWSKGSITFTASAATSRIGAYALIRGQALYLDDFTLTPVF
jgi:hypothetical protein